MDTTTSKPWENEPDEVEWTDEATGLDCLIWRNTMRALCGYVRIEPEHPLFGKGHNDSGTYELDVHGGITFGGWRKDSAWWLGFDCSHAGDLIPQFVELSRAHEGIITEAFGETYKTIEYVKAECASLARQLKELERGHSGQA